MILIRNRLKKHLPLSSYTEQIVAAMLSQLSYADFDISITLTTNQTIKQYNAHYRKKNKPTDVISFPHHPLLRAGERIKVNDPEDQALGDIIISVERTARDARQLGVSFDERFRLLLAHGIAHLLGHDHEKDDEYRVMRKLEIKLLEAAQAVPKKT